MHMIFTTTNEHIEQLRTLLRENEFPHEETRDEHGNIEVTVLVDLEPDPSIAVDRCRTIAEWYFRG